MKTTENQKTAWTRREFVSTALITSAAIMLLQSIVAGALAAGTGNKSIDKEDGEISTITVKAGASIYYKD